jgi:Flp pilus assembly protein TadG
VKLKAAPSNSGRAGQSLVEFAILAPILLILVAVGADLGRAFFVGTQVTDTAREAALYAGQHGNDAGTTESSLTTTMLQVMGQAGSGYAVLNCPSWSSPPTQGAAANVTVAFTPANNIPPATNTTTQVVITTHCVIPALAGFAPLPVQYTTQSTVRELIVGPAG